VRREVVGAREKWTAIVAKMQESGLSQRKFAVSEKLNLHTLKYWNLKLKSKRPDRAPSFVKVHNKKFRSEVQLKSNWGFRIITREGAIIESSERLGATEAAQLLLLLKG
jgi:hypothetical protein